MMHEIAYKRKTKSEKNNHPSHTEKKTKQKTNWAKIIVRTVQMKGEYMYEKPGKIHNRLKLSVK